MCYNIIETRCYSIARHYNSIRRIFNNQFNNKSMLNYICVNHNMKLLITYSRMKAYDSLA